MKEDSKNFSDVSEAIYHAKSIPEAILRQIDLLKNLQNRDALILANNAELYYNYIINNTLQDKLRLHFENLYSELNKSFPYVLFRLEGRIKSWVSAYKKMLIENVLKDIFAFRIIVFEDSLDLCYKIAEYVINYSINQGFIPCHADQPKGIDKFDPIKHPDVRVPTKPALKKEMQVYVKDYIMHPKEKGYQSLHIIFRDTDGNYFEIQIRNIKMHMHAEHGSAKHDVHKARYPDIYLDRSKVDIPGYQCTTDQDGKKHILDFVGLEEALVIFHRQKTHV